MIRALRYVAINTQPHRFFFFTKFQPKNEGDADLIVKKMSRAIKTRALFARPTGTSSTLCLHAPTRPGRSCRSAGEKALSA